MQKIPRKLGLKSIVFLCLYLKTLLSESVLVYDSSESLR